MAQRNLRAVKASDTPAKPARQKHTVATAAAEGDKIDLLIAMRDRIAVTVDNPDCPPRELAALTKRLGDIVEELDKLKAAEPDGAGGEGDADDESFDAAAV